MSRMAGAHAAKTGPYAINSFSFSALSTRP